MATLMATSIGVRPALLASQAAAGWVAATACRTGTSSAARAEASPVVAGADPHGEDGRDQDVDVAQQVEDAGVGPQGVAPHRQSVRAPRLDGPAQVLDEAGVPGQHVGPVEDDAHGRPRGVVSPVAQHPVGRDLDRRLVRVAGDEAQELLGVGQATGGQVLEGAGHGGRWGSRQGGQLGVGRRLAAEGEERDRRGQATPA
jgi:hypothetical protein